jgi:lysozyme
VKPRRGRRILVGVIIALSLVFLVVALAWFAWLPRWRPSLADGERYGIDVSHHQGRIGWKEVAADEVAFAYIKATEGGDFLDDRFVANWAAAGEAGLDRGAYHFFTLCTPGIEQAQHFLSVLPEDAELAPAVDLELAGNCSDQPTREAVLDELGAFLDAVEATVGREVLLYLGDDFEDRYEVRDHLDRPLWLRRLVLRPSQTWTVWQASGQARIEGIDGPVDLDVMRQPGVAG